MATEPRQLVRALEGMVVDVPEGVWRLTLTMTNVDGTRFRARRVIGRSAARASFSGEADLVGKTAHRAAGTIIEREALIPRKKAEQVA